MTEESDNLTQDFNGYRAYKLGTLRFVAQQRNLSKIVKTKMFVLNAKHGKQAQVKIHIFRGSSYR